MKNLLILLLLVVAQFSFAQKEEKIDNKWIGKTIPFMVNTENAIKLGFGQIYDSDSGYMGFLFKNRVSFYNTVFSKEVDLSYAKFSLFAKFSDFSDASFYANSSFEGAEFSNVTFSNANFKQDVYFIAVDFMKESDFREVNFKKNSYFTYTDFNDNAYFSRSIFSKGAYFRYTKFTKSLDLSEARFDSTLHVEQVQLPDSLLLQKTKLKYDVRFDHASIDFLKKRGKDKCKIFLDSETDLDKLVLDASKFELAFNKETPYDEQRAVYEQVIKKCKDVGLLESVKGFDIDYQKIQIRHSYPFSNSIIWFDEYWWNFGYSKTKAYRNTAIAFGLSSLLFFIFLPHYLKAYLPSSIRIEDPLKENLKGWQRLKVVLFFTALIFFSLKMEHEKVKYKEFPGRALVVYLVFTLGIIHLAYLAAAILNK